MIDAHDTLNPVFYLVQYPRHQTVNCPLRFTVVVLFVIDVEFDIEFFSLCGVVIDLLLYKAVILVVIYPDDKSVLGLRLVIDLNFVERMQSIQSNCKRK